MQMPVEILKCHPDALIPTYESSGACAFDIATIETTVIESGQIARLRTGLVICVPEQYTLLIVARSSLPKRYGLCVPQGFGIIDNDFCGEKDELLIQLLNFTDKPTRVEKGARLVQGMFVPFTRARFAEVNALAQKSRGGFGSTG